MRPFQFVMLLVVVILLVTGCNSAPETVEVTRIVNQEIPVTVEVPVEVQVEVPVEVQVEVPVEVTRVVEVEVEVEVVATPTALANEEDGTDTAETPEAEATPESTEAVNNVYTVVDGDSWALIAYKTQTQVSLIRAANDMEKPTRLFAGMELVIPEWDGVVQQVGEPITPTTEGGAITAVNNNPNLLPNASFEDDWYFYQGVSEWQIPVNWLLAVNEGSNTLTPEEGDMFIRPEVRVVPRSDLPADEHGMFVFDGDKTIKSFKNGLPIQFAIFTDIRLPAGSYRFTIRFFPDIVSAYNGGTKVWATDPLAAEVRIIYNNGGTGWTPVTSGQRGTMTYDFTLTQPATVRLGGDFRNRYINENNGWFLDNWALQRLETP